MRADTQRSVTSHRFVHGGFSLSVPLPSPRDQAWASLPEDGQSHRCPSWGHARVADTREPGKVSRVPNPVRLSPAARETRAGITTVWLLPSVTLAADRPQSLTHRVRSPARRRPAGPLEERRFREAEGSFEVTLGAASGPEALLGPPPPKCAGLADRRARPSLPSRSPRSVRETRVTRERGPIQAFWKVRRRGQVPRALRDEAKLCSGRMGTHDGLLGGGHAVTATSPHSRPGTA